MHGLYCTHEHCYSRVTDGNLVPPTACESCGENAFYAESLDEKVDPGYFCISCGKKTEI